MTKKFNFKNTYFQINDTEATSLTANTIRTTSIRLSLHLKSLGVGLGNYVGIIARNSTYLSSIVFGSLFLGAPISPLDNAYNAEDIAKIFKATKPKVVFCDYDLIPNLLKAYQILKRETIIVCIGKQVNGFRVLDDFLKQHDDEINFVLVTSFYYIYESETPFLEYFNIC